MIVSCWNEERRENEKERKRTLNHLNLWICRFLYDNRMWISINWCYSMLNFMDLWVNFCFNQAQKHLQFDRNYSIASNCLYFFTILCDCMCMVFIVHQGFQNMHKDFFHFAHISIKKMPMKWVFMQNANHGSIQCVCRIVNKNLHFWRICSTEITVCKI